MGAGCATDDLTFMEKTDPVLRSDVLPQRPDLRKEVPAAPGKTRRMGADPAPCVILSDHCDAARAKADCPAP